MDLAFVQRVWDKWASGSIGPSGKPVKVALLLHYDPAGSLHLYPTIAKQEGIKGDPVQLSQFLWFVRHKKLSESFSIDVNEYIVTSVLENGFCARCMNSCRPEGEGAIVMKTARFVVVALYEGAIGSASHAIAAVDQLWSQLSRRNL